MRSRARSTTLHARLVVGGFAALAITALGLPVAGPAPAAAADPQPTACPKTFLTAAEPDPAGVCATTSTDGVATQAVASGLPAGFQESVVWSGLTNPMAIRFAADGRVFVTEKFGRIKVFDSLSDPTPTTYTPTSFRNNVFSYWDRGLLGLALDPSLTGGSGNGSWVYVLYTYDHIIGTSPDLVPRWGDGCPTPPGPTTDGCVASARLSRFAVSGSTITGTEEVLIEDWCQQFPSHSIGTLVFGPDGALYVGAGDGASFTGIDYGQRGGSLTGTPTPINPCGDPPGGAMTPPTAEGGALRSQDMRTTGDPAGLDGTILRVNPNTGLGMAGNPFAASADLNARRIIAYGLRNPFRFTARPGTNELWLGEVGFETWEEIDKIPNMADAVAENFGWPCYEGPAPQTGYDGTDLALCENLYAAVPGTVTGPEFAYSHTAKVVAGEGCPSGSSSLSGIAFYPETGGTFPVAYRGGLFFADYSRSCIWFAPKVSGQPDFSAIQTFLDGATNPVDLAVGPDGFLYYVDFGDLGQPTGSIRRIIPPGSNQPPVARFTATPSSGPVPLDVQFDAGASSDAEGSALTYAWDLDGDGQYDDASGVTTARTYSTPGNVTVGLRVTDVVSATGTTSHVIMVANDPPVPVISTPSASLTWKVGDTISFSGSATDPQDGQLPASALSWSLVLQHCPSNCHSHPQGDPVSGSSGSFVAPDHSYPSYLELTLTATDSFGTQASVTRRLNPKTVVLSFKTSPPGLKLAVGASTSTAPFSRTVIVGSSNSVTATSPQTIASGTYAFSSWSDGKAQSHQIVAPATNTTYTATYRPTKLTIRPSADAQVRVGHPNTNYGAASLLRVREAKSRVYLKFVVDGLTRPPTSAKIRLWVTNPGPDAGRLYRAPTTWTESTITWNNAPPPIGGVVDYAGPAAGGTWLILNVKPVITGDGRYAFVLRGGTADFVDFASRETTHDPLLVIVP